MSIDRRSILYATISKCLLGYRAHWRGLEIRGPEDESLAILREGNTQFEESGNDSGEVLEEKVLILGILLNPGSEALVAYKSHVSWQHHERFGGLILVLRTCESISFEQLGIFVRYVPACYHPTSSQPTFHPIEVCRTHC